MILGYDIFSTSILANALPARQSFSKIRLLDQSVNDELHVHNTEVDDTILLNLGTEESFSADTVLLAHMNSGLGAGDYDSLDTPIYKYIIYKRKVGDSKYEKFTEVLQESGITTIYDFSCKNNREYEYFLIPIGQDGSIGSGTTGTIKLNFWGWYLSSVDNQKNYKFDLNIESSNIQNVLNIQIQNSNSKFPKITQNKQNYIQGSLSTIPYSVSGTEYVFDINILEDIRDFLCDGEIKVLRNTAGEGMQVRISSSPQIKYYDQVQRDTLCPFVLTFEFVQVGDII
jgi:hypothetical protein